MVLINVNIISISAIGKMYSLICLNKKKKSFKIIKHHIFLGIVNQNISQQGYNIFEVGGFSKIKF